MNEEAEIKTLLKKNLEISKESYKILKKVHRSQKIGRVLKTVYWLIIIGGLFGAYYYLQPVISSLIDSVKQITEDFTALGETGRALGPGGISPELLDKVQEALKSN
jgi:hypothetical protein